MTPRREPIRKVSAFITRGDRLLVFRKPNHPGTGTQLPAGTVEPGESPETAVLREAREETGLDGFTWQGLLGRDLLDQQRYGQHELHDRWYFHLRAPADPPEAWGHGESDPSDGSSAFIPYDFFWVDVFDDPQDMRPYLVAVLPILRRRLGERQIPDDQ